MSGSEIKNRKGLRPKRSTPGGKTTQSHTPQGKASHAPGHADKTGPKY